MLAQRTGDTVRIDAVEQDEQACNEARENFVQSPWYQRIHAYHSQVQSFQKPGGYDLIVCNPPFFQSGQRPPNESRTQQRHATTLTYSDLLDTARRLLTPAGRLSLILPATETTAFIRLARVPMLHVTRNELFRTRRDRPAERTLLEFLRNPGKLDTGENLLAEEDRSQSTAYTILTREFYL